MIEITRDIAKAALEAAMDEKGKDFVYKKPEGVKTPFDACLYVHGNEPGCIVGHVLYALGVPLERMAAHESDTAMTLLKALHDEGLVRRTAAADLMLHDAQVEQDSGKSWGNSVQVAISRTNWGDDDVWVGE